MYTQWERMKPLGVDGFPVHFFQSLSSGIPLPQPLKMMPYSIHQWKPYFFLRSLLVQKFFFSGEPLCTNFYFQTKYCFFLTVKSWFIIYLFVLYKLFYTHNRSKDTGHFNVKSFRKCTHSERGWSHLEWTVSLCIFF